jgi:hypothetical protein
MAYSVRFWWVGALLLAVGVGVRAQQRQDVKAQEMVRVAVKTELAADREDHTRWSFNDVDKKPDGAGVYRVVETDRGSVKKKIEWNGRALTPEELQREDARIEAFVGDAAQQAKQKKDGAQDDKRAENMLRMLPDAFLWRVVSDSGETVELEFVPDPGFDPSSMESRVFAAMAGELVVDKKQNRIKTMKGKLVADVKFGWGLFGKMNKGGTFNVERRELAPGVWQITESHVHIDGKALLFKTISEQEDEVKTEFRRMPPATTLEQAAILLKGEPGAENASSKVDAKGTFPSGR